MMPAPWIPSAVGMMFLGRERQALVQSRIFQFKQGGTAPGLERGYSGGEI